jgi:hypothetical protein
MKNSSKILNRRNVQKKITFFCLTVLLEGGDEIRSLSLGFCDEIKHHKTVTFLWQIEIFLDFLLGFRTFRHFFEKFNTFWYNMEFLYIKEPIREPPALLLKFLNFFFK